MNTLTAANSIVSFITCRYSITTQDISEDEDYDGNSIVYTSPARDTLLSDLSNKDAMGLMLMLRKLELIATGGGIYVYTATDDVETSLRSILYDVSLLIEASFS